MHTLKRWWLDVTIFYDLYFTTKKAYQIHDYIDTIKDFIWFARKVVAVPFFVVSALLFMSAQFIDPEVEDNYEE